MSDAKSSDLGLSLAPDLAFPLAGLMGAGWTGALVMGLLALAGWQAWRRWRGQRMLIVTVIDGDTLVAVTEAGKKMRLRLRGVDCPEMDQLLGEDAKQAAAQRVHKQWLKVRRYHKDHYGRWVADVWLANGALLQAELVRLGLAHVLPNGSWRWRWTQWGARLRGKGVHGWGHRAPWQHRQKKGFFNALLGMLSRRRQRRLRQQAQTKARQTRRQR